MPNARFSRPPSFFTSALTGGALLFSLSACSTEDGSSNDDSAVAESSGTTTQSTSSGPTPLPTTPLASNPPPQPPATNSGPPVTPVATPPLPVPTMSATTAPSSIPTQPVSTEPQGSGGTPTEPSSSSSGGAGNSDSGGAGGETLAGGSGGSAGASGASGSSPGGSANGGSGGTPALAEFVLTIGEVDAHDNEACQAESCDTCPDFPPENTGIAGNADISPVMSWGPGPEGTQSYAIVLTDLSNGETHWVLWDIPASITSLPEALPEDGQLGDVMPELADARQTTGFNRTPLAYFGSGACSHVYEFRLYALNTATLTDAGANANAVHDTLDNSNAVLGSTFVRLHSDSSEGCMPHYPPECP